MRNLNRTSLAASAAWRFFFAMAMIALILFGSAGTWTYWNAWLFIGLMSISMSTVLVYLVTYDPELLQKRMQYKEREKEQKWIQKIGALPFVIGFVLPGLDYRFSWSSVPMWIVFVSAFLVVLGYALFVVVLRQNSFASRIIELQAEQVVVDHGLYSKIRHPMYLSTLIILTFSPLVLGSYVALLPFLTYPVILVFRIKNEEEVLVKGLAGYEDYRRRVKYRLLPFVW